MPPRAPNREIFKDDGTPEEPTKTWWREEQARQKHIQNVPQNPELAEIVKTVDFRLLKDIFARTAERCGIPREEMNFLSAKHFDAQGKFTREDRPALGEYDAYHNFARLYHDQLDEEAQRLGLPTEYLALKTLIHEEIHALSSYKRKTKPGRNPEDKRTDIRTTGYQTAHIAYHGNAPSTKYFFELFDEGVTQRYTGEVLQEYLRATGAPADIAEQFDRMFRPNARIQVGYALPMRFVETLAARLSHETGIPQDNVWDAILRGKLEGHDLFDDEFARSLAELVGDDILTPLMQANRTDESESARILSTLTLKLARPLPKERRSLFATLIPKITKVIGKPEGPPEDR